ncbi:MAG: hypothetical protein PHN56_06820 [Candidatus Nanoarchaeia archaeon]|nr:hypothetical protein [Candidatus Nanoarchaeia archaeon]
MDKENKTDEEIPDDKFEYLEKAEDESDFDFKKRLKEYNEKIKT